MREIDAVITMEARARVQIPAKIPVPDDLDLNDEAAVSAYVSDYEYEHDLLGQVDLNQCAELEDRHFDGVTVNAVHGTVGEEGS